MSILKYLSAGLILLGGGGGAAWAAKDAANAGDAVATHIVRHTADGIISTTTVPEFGLVASLILVVSIISVVIISYKTKLRISGT